MKRKTILTILVIAISLIITSSYYLGFYLYNLSFFPSTILGFISLCIFMFGGYYFFLFLITVGISIRDIFKILFR